MRVVVLVVAILALLVLGGSLALGFLPLSPSQQTVEQRIPDAQISR